jgi:CheY-like chemotaxis protein
MHGKPQVLIVDDSDDDIELTSAALGTLCDVRCNAVSSAEDALDFLYRRGAYAERSTDPLALILLDIKMPEIDGLELLGIIKSHEQFRLIPVVMLTSSGEECDIEASYRLGSNAYVVKPMQGPELVAALRKTEAFWLRLNQPPPASSCPNDRGADSRTMCFTGADE